jgi:hypothetical protein
MEEAGWIDSAWGTTQTGRRARFYKLMPAGRRQLEPEKEQWERLTAGVALVLAWEDAWAGVAGGRACGEPSVGTLAGYVAQRTREIGVRMALDATPPAVAGTVTRRGVALATAGGAVGAFAWIGFGNVLSQLPVDAEPVGAFAAFATLAGFLVLAAIVSFGPARRVARVDPMTALRADPASVHAIIVPSPSGERSRMATPRAHRFAPRRLRRPAFPARFRAISR